jgi:ATP-dependent DNA ligase
MRIRVTPVQIASRRLPQLGCPNALGIVRHSTLWLKPETVAQIDFQEWTNASMLRGATFVRLRDDKDPRKVVRET